MTYCWQHMWLPTYVGRPDKQGLLDCNTICFISVLYSIYSLSYSFSTVPFYPILCLSFSLTLVFNPFGFQPLSLSLIIFLSLLFHFSPSPFFCVQPQYRKGVSHRRIITVPPHRFVASSFPANVKFGRTPTEFANLLALC